MDPLSIVGRPVKHLLAGVLLFSVVGSVRGQLTVAGQPNAQVLAQSISGTGVVISNAVVTCHSLGFGQYSYTGSAMDLTQGVILTSGRITDALGPNNNTGTTNWFAQNTGGDPLLDIVTGRSTRDACKFEFDLIPSGDSLRFEFTFGSEEYNEWVGSQFNDVFGFFISGPGIVGDPGAGGAKNIALLPGTSTAVTINNVNNSSNSVYYHDNTGGSQTQYDGYTVNLAARSPVQPCQSYHLKLVIADATDRKYDSGVFIEKIESPTITLSTYAQNGTPYMIESCNPGWIRFDRGSPRPTPLTLQYFLQGTATNGTDYSPIGNVDPSVAKLITIPANQAYVDRPVVPLFDVLNEGTEYIRCILGNPNCPGAALDSIDFDIIDSLFATCTPGGTICQGGSWPLTVTGGAAYSWTPSTGLSCTTCPNPVASPSTTTTYQVTVTDGSCARVFNRQVRVSQLALSALVTDVLCQGQANGAINLSTSGGIAPFAYSWTGPGGFTANTQDISGLQPGTYSVTVTDAACTRTSNWNVLAPSALTVSLSPALLPFGQNISCHGGNDGSIDATITGGTGPYAVSWTGPGGFTSSLTDINGLYAGAYAMSVTDAHGCTANAGATLIQTTAMVASITSITPVLCLGDGQGSASAMGSGGVPPFTYDWNSTPVQTTATATALPAGSYAVTVTDGYGCTASANATIPGPTTALTTNLTSQTNVLCNGASTGSATISISGGTPAYATTWNTVPVQSGSSATSLPAGTWTATVVDANGCAATRNVTITQPASALTASIFSQTAVLCHGGSTGAATVSASGGTGPFTYQWNTVPVQNTATATNLPAGGYACTVTDVNGCQVVVNVSITQPAAPLSTSISAQSDVSCFGDATGSATITATGGTGPYVHSWNTSPVQTAATATGLVAGTWTCTVTDANGCSATRNVTITQPALPLGGSITAQTNVLCHANATGSATVNGSGGSAPYTYSWNTAPVQTGPTAGGLAAGSYSCTITDANGCSVVLPVTITQPAAALAASIASQSNVLCFGNSTGGATATVSGGTALYAYSWNTVPAQTTAAASDLSAGTYTCTITDANGCGTTTSATITQPAASLAASISSQSNVLVYGMSTGSATATAAGGVPAYAYLWSNGQTGATASGLAAGTYSVTVTDAGGCTAVALVTITQPGSALVASVITSTDVACHGDATGSTEVLAAGGVAPYSYSWNTVPVQIGSIATGLAAGTWTCTVTDANGAITSVPVTIAQPVAPLSTSIVGQVAVDCNGASTGSATISASGGTPLYAFSWNTLPAQIGATATALAAGAYTCLVVDANGCSAAQNVTIAQPAQPLTASITGQDDVACHGGSDGTATALATGGTAPYTYSWNTPVPGSAATAVNLIAGLWTCSVTDANGCGASINVTISEPPQSLAVNISGTTQATCGSLNGGATAVASGGTAPFTYAWNSIPVQNSAGLVGVGPGTYTVDVMDANGCTAQAQTTITAPGVLGISHVSTVAQACFGTANGQATVNASGGTTPYAYSWNTSPAQTGATASGLVAGSYMATVIDANGCTASINVVVNGPSSALALTTDTIVDVLCHGGVTGEAHVIAMGGLAPYAITWNTLPIQSGPDATGLSAGTWTATVVDAYGCSNSLNVVVDQPVTPINAYVDDMQDVSCTGGSDGYATFEVTGGSGNHSVVWNTVPAQTGLTATGLAPGTYTITVTDNNGCPDAPSFDVTIGEPAAPISITTAISDHNGSAISCIGATDGSIDASVAGGTAGYAYSWTGPGGFTSSSQDINGLQAGNYQLTVTDANGCSAVHATNLAQPGAIIVSSNITSAACNGASNGAVDATVSGGTSPYTHAWAGPGGALGATEDISGVPAGVYSLTVTDANGCTQTSLHDVNEPMGLGATATLSAYPGGSNVSCAGSFDGAIDATATGGIAPYTYQWNGPAGFTASSEDLSGLQAGAYDLTIIDANGCGTLVSFVLNAPAALFAALAPQVFPSGANTSCAGSTDGTIDATIIGGTPGYVLGWTGPNGFTSTVEDPNGLETGSYTLTAWDVNGCSTSQSVTLSAPNSLAVTYSVSQYNSGDEVHCNGASTGVIDLTVGGGLAPYMVNWTGPGGFTSTSTDLFGIPAGTYAATITDAAGCDTLLSFTLTEPQPLLVAGAVSDHSGFAVGCAGAFDGSVDLSISGGSAPYTFTWMGPNAFVSNTEDVSALEAGQYDVIVMDLNGCKDYGTYILSAPAEIAPTAVITTAPCLGTDDGAIDLTITGGVSPYATQWTGPGAYSASTEDITDLYAGIYSVAITDTNGCTFNASYTITQPGDLVVSALIATHPGGYGVSCSGASDGAIDVTAIGGTPPLFYFWQGPGGFTAITQDISGAVAGSYDLTITDANGCSQLMTWTITTPTPINIGLSPSQFPNGSNVGCSGGTDGSIDAIIAGGVAPYSIAWSGPGGGLGIAEDLTGLVAGTYVIDVIDALGCSASASITLVEPSPMLATVSTSTYPSSGNVSCMGETDGSIDLEITGGSLLYLINWTGPGGFASNDQDLAGLSAGTYQLSVTDANGCVATAAAVLNAPPPIVVDLVISQYSGGFAIDCSGNASGSIDAVVQGGAIPWTYLWTGPAGFTSTSPNLNGVPAGVYDLVVTDAAGCTATATATLSEPTTIDMTSAVSDAGNGFQVGCAGNDGSITLQVNGGIGPYLFDWSGSGGFASLDQDLSGLAAGTYIVTIIDVNGCEAQGTFDLEQALELTASTVITGNVCDGLDDGAIDLSVSGGVLPYQFNWSGPGAFSSSSEDLDSLVGGAYTVNVVDANGCSTQVSASIAASSPIGLGLYVSDYGLFNLPCFGDSSGTIEATITGGALPLDVTWGGPGGFTSDAPFLNGLLAGDYDLSIVDVNGCSLDTVITLTAPAAPLGATLSAVMQPSGTSVSCFGGYDGSVDLTVAGGVAPFDITWHGPPAESYDTEDLAGVVAGLYDVVIADANGCTYSTSIILSEPDSALATSVSVAQYAGGFNTSCDGSTDGAIAVTVAGGSGGYLINWSGPGGFASTADSIVGLAEGQYVVTVTDMNGCAMADTIDLVAPEPLVPIFNAQFFPGGSNISCNGMADGTLSVAITGGAPAFALNWNGPGGFTGSSDVLTGLAAGTYCLDIVDANGCLAQQCITLTEPAALAATAATTDEVCGGVNGAIDLSVSGGSMPYGHAWSNGPLNEDQSGLSAGLYTVIVTDTNGCSFSLPVNVQGSASLAADAAVTDLVCAGSPDGAINLTMLTGTAPYAFGWSDGSVSEDISGLVPGDYDVTVTDANGCSWSGTFIVADGATITADGSVHVFTNGYNVSSAGAGDGSISVSAAGGTAPYSFAWNTGASGAMINGLDPGMYSVMITDAAGCSTTLVFEVTGPEGVVLPTGFSPNGDGANDHYVVPGLDAFSYNHFTVFNRWGNVVYERINYANEWSGESSQGDQLPNGTYFVILDAEHGRIVLQDFVDLRR